VRSGHSGKSGDRQPHVVGKYTREETRSGKSLSRAGRHRTGGIGNDKRETKGIERTDDRGWSGMRWAKTNASSGLKRNTYAR
jgi:hypothetical protein